MIKRMTNSQYQEAGNREAERVVHLDEITSGILFKIAKACIEHKGGAYFAIIDGIKTKVIA